MKTLCLVFLCYFCHFVQKWKNSPFEEINSKEFVKNDPDFANVYI